MATAAQRRLWEQQMHQEYCSWVESMNAGNRARAQANGGPALITDPDTGRQKMEGLCPGQMVWFDVKDGPRSQRGRRHFYGPGWHGPFPEYGVVATAEHPPTLVDKIQALLRGGSPGRPDSTLVDRIRAKLRGVDLG